MSAAMEKLRERHRRHMVVDASCDANQAVVAVQDLHAALLQIDLAEEAAMVEQYLAPLQRLAAHMAERLKGD